jgi:cytochrome c oxidase accessory protein FixG
MVLLTQLVFYGLPWLEWGQRQAVLFDLGARRFYIFGLVLYPQDFIYLTGILVISALSLFLFTAVAGRLWCGYACPQTVYTEIFLWIEKKMEGDRSARMRRDEGPMSFDKFWRKAGKHLLWLAVALWTGFTFVGYFTPIQVLGQRRCCRRAWVPGRSSGACSTASQPMAMPASCANRSASTCAPTRASRARCSTRTR